ncbi:transposase, partial [Methylocaldum sp. 14B]|uniref:transposase n=1 Tax=Methylocaldum sp. 14B TaxID=1912213 RepID=UPI00197C8F7B
MTNPDVLPDEIPALKTLIEAQRVEIAHLKLLVAKLRRQQFGRRSEKMAGLLDQLELQLEELETGDAELASIIAPRSAPRRVRTPRALPDHLPREIHIHEPDLTQCPDC